MNEVMVEIYRSNRAPLVSYANAKTSRSGDTT